MENIRAHGYMNIISEIGAGKGKIIAKDFFEGFMEEFIKQAGRFINAVSEGSFMYGESQLNTIIAPALSKITPAFLMESPVTRKWSSIRNEDWEDSTGHVDYWCNYRDIDFLIEIKHSWDAYNSDEVTKETQNKWESVLTQVSLIKDDAKELSKYSNGVFLLPLLIVPIFETVPEDNEPDSIENFNELLDIQDEYRDKLKPKPNWHALWILNENLTESCKFEYENKTEYYPGVLFFSKLSKLI